MLNFLGFWVFTFLGILAAVEDRYLLLGFCAFMILIFWFSFLFSEE